MAYNSMAAHVLSLEYMCAYVPNFHIKHEETRPRARVDMLRFKFLSEWCRSSGYAGTTTTLFRHAIVSTIASLTDLAIALLDHQTGTAMEPDHCCQHAPALAAHTVRVFREE